MATLEEIVDRYGVAAVFLFVALVGVFVALHVVRLPVVALAAVLAWAMRRVDATVTTRLTPGSGSAYSAAAGGGRR